MDVAAVALQQVASQTNVGLSILKQNAKEQQALVDLVTQAAATGSRGQKLDITV